MTSTLFGMEDLTHLIVFSGSLTIKNQRLNSQLKERRMALWLFWTYQYKDALTNYSPKSIEKKLTPRDIFIGALITQRIAN